MHLQGIARFPIDQIIDLRDALCRVSVALVDLHGQRVGLVLLALRSDRLVGDLPASADGVGNPLKYMSGPGPQFVIVSAGGDTSIGVLQPNVEQKGGEGTSEEDE